MKKSWKLCAAAEQMRKEINALYPNRDKRSDGAVGDTSHQARKSDHNPDWENGGFVRAIDIDEDLLGAKKPDPVEANKLCLQLVELGKKDKRLKYIIFEGKIYSATYKWASKPYTGVNAHSHHIHVSFNVSGDTDGRPFNIKKV